MLPASPRPPRAAHRPAAARTPRRMPGCTCGHDSAPPTKTGRKGLLDLGAREPRVRRRASTPTRRAQSRLFANFARELRVRSRVESGRHARFITLRVHSRVALCARQTAPFTRFLPQKRASTVRKGFGAISCPSKRRKLQPRRRRSARLRRAARRWLLRPRSARGRAIWRPMTTGSQFSRSAPAPPPPPRQTKEKKTSPTCDSPLPPLPCARRALPSPSPTAAAAAAFAVRTHLLLAPGGLAVVSGVSVCPCACALQLTSS